jgi:hypothetical protein
LFNGPAATRRSRWWLVGWLVDRRLAMRGTRRRSSFATKRLGRGARQCLVLLERRSRHIHVLPLRSFTHTSKTHRVTFVTMKSGFSNSELWVRMMREMRSVSRATRQSCVVLCRFWRSWRDWFGLVSGMMVSGDDRCRAEGREVFW